MKRTLQDYSSGIKPVWCPGCGDYGVLRGLQQAMVDLDIVPEETITISGIGCSGRFSHYMNSYNLHGTHGRAVPTAIGAKAARPELTVLCVGGDGDGLGIGGGHIPHAARKNVDMTYILIDNRIYGLTKGQSSPTTPIDLQTKTAPYGVYEEPMNAIPIFLTYGISFIARTSPIQMGAMTEILKQAISHKGFSLVYIMAPCVTFPVVTFKGLKDMLTELPEDYDPTDRMRALEMAYAEDTMYTGIFYKVNKPTLEDNLQAMIRKACASRKGEKFTVKQMLESYT
ncbi:2-oxoacid:ferredoxin oxidoreductase subunit beta [bacterium]|nr:2-oxoacid:ferredoxin oxidoreductase subunit beta [bacterium]